MFNQAGSVIPSAKKSKLPPLPKNKAVLVKQNCHDADILNGWPSYAPIKNVDALLCEFQMASNLILFCKILWLTSGDLLPKVEPLHWQ